MNVCFIKIELKMNRDTHREGIKLTQAKYKIQVLIRVSVMVSNRRMLSKINLSVSFISSFLISRKNRRFFMTKLS
jgi:hypothetical protein